MTAVLLAMAGRRPGLRDLLTAGAALVALGSALSAAAPAFAVLAAAQGVIGVGIGLLVAAGIAAAGEWPAPAQRPHVLAWAIAGMPAAWIAGMPVVGAVAEVDWRAAWLAVPTVVALAALALVRLRPADPPSLRSRDSVSAWRRPDVARFAAGELLANAAWASVLTYGGALLLSSYDLSPAVVALGLGAHRGRDAPGHVRGPPQRRPRDAGAAGGPDGVPGRGRRGARHRTPRRRADVRGCSRRWPS